LAGEVIKQVALLRLHYEHPESVGARRL